MRKLIRVILFMLLAMASQHAFALRVGDIEVYSALNQPLEAEISIVSDRPGEADGMIIALASEEVFEQQGVPWVFHLTKLRFQLDSKPDGSQIIKVTTKKPVREPFLDFLIDLDWPTGRLVRKFTILLDPPVFASKKAEIRPKDSSSSTSDSFFFEEDDVVKDDSGTLPDISVSTVGEPSLIQRESQTDDDSFLLSEDKPLSDEPISDTSVDFDEGSLAETDDVTFTDADSPEETVDTDGDSFFFDEPTEEETSFDDTSLVADADIDTETLVEADTLDDSDSSFLVDEQDTSDSLFEEDSTEEDALASNDESESAFSAEEDDYTLGDLGTTESYSIPDIRVALDESIPYDVERTQQLLREFAAEDGTSFVQTGDYEVKEGDYLWNIASGITPEGVSVNQAMLAIMRYNPDAFIRDNINNIKKGAVLRMPSRQEMLEVNESESLVEVNRQNGLWREYKNQLAGTSSTSDLADSDFSSSSRISGTEDDTSTRLSIVAPGHEDEGSSRISGQQDGLEDGTSADTNLLLAQEALEAERLEKFELQDRLKDLEEQVSMMQRLITLKDQQYAELQAQLGDQTGQQTVSAELDETDESLVETPSDDAGIDSELVSDEPAAQATDSETETTSAIDESELIDSDFTSLDTEDGDLTAESQDLIEEDSVEDSSVLDEDSETLQADDAELLESDANTETLTEDDTLPLDDSSEVLEETVATETDEGSEVADVPEPQQQTTYLSFLSNMLPKPYNAMLEDFLSQPYGLPVLVAMPLILIIMIVLVLRKVGKGGKTKEKAIFLHEPPQDDHHDELLEDDIPDMPDDFAEEPTAEEPLAAEAEFNPDRTQTINEAVQEAAIETQDVAPPAAAAEEDDEPMDDTTAEADVYLAYGLFDQAEDLLKQALASNPDKHEYRGKLLETYFAEGKRQEFEALARELQAAVGGSGRLWDKAVAMGKEIAPDSDLFSGVSGSGLKASDFAPAKPEAADIDLGGEATTTDVDLAVGGAEQETDFDLGLDEPEASTQSMADTVISPADTMAAESEAAAIAGDIDTELEFDLSDADTGDDEIADDLDMGLDLDFNADDLGLGEGEPEDDEMETILEAPDEEPVPAPSPAPAAKAQPEETVALDMDMNLDELDLGDITNTDDTDFDLDDFADAMEGGDGAEDTTGSSAADELLAEIDAADLDLTMPGETGEDTIIEDEDESDETIITADIDFDETFTGDSSDDDISMDEVNTKLDLARAYIDMGDNDGASSTLNEVIAEGSDQQRKEAKSLLAQIG